MSSPIKLERSASEEVNVFYNVLLTREKVVYYHINMDDIKASIKINIKLENVEDLKATLEFELKYNERVIDYKHDEQRFTVKQAQEVKKTIDEWVKSYEQYSDSIVTTLINFVEQISQ